MVSKDDNKGHDAVLDTEHMAALIDLAQAAADAGEVPVAACLVQDGTVLATAVNDRELAQDPLGHAELLCLQKAAKTTGLRRFPNATLYVTLEPCLMCLGAIIHAQVGRVVYGASDSKTGAMYLLKQDDLKVNHKPEVTSGVLAEAVEGQLKDFFKTLRQKRKAQGTKAVRKRRYEANGPVKEKFHGQ